MALTTDEQAMRSALQELSGAQPDAPVDRVDGARRRYRRRRTAQSLVAALGVAALVAGVVSVATALRTAHTPSTVAATPALPWQLGWPERTDGTVDKQRVLFWLGQQGFDDLRDVRWLYTVTAPDTINEWAILEADYASSPGTVRANALLTVVSHDRGGSWTTQTHAAPPVSTKMIAVADQQGHAVLVFAAPGVKAAELVNVHRTNDIDTEPFPSLENGVGMLTAPTAWQPGSTVVREPGAPSTWLVLFDNDDQATGEPGWWKPAPQRPHGDVAIGATFGGGGSSVSNMRSPRTGTLVLQVRCVGPVPLRLVVTTTSTTEDVDVDRCDGLFHSYFGPQAVAGEKLGLENHGDQGQNNAVIDLSVRP